MKRPRPTSIPLLVLLAAAAAAAAAQSSKTHPASGTAHEKHWAYEDGADEVGPEHWGEMPGNQPCSIGQRQSPIALATSGPGAATAATEPHEAFAYRPSKISLVNNGHTVQESYEKGSSITEGAATYRLAQFHFHAPSEHTLDGKTFPLEVHFVHTDAEGKPALVVGVFVREGARNEAIDRVFARLPKASGQKTHPAGTVDAASLLPADKSHFVYDGSLTTPPCSEGIRWRVMREPIEMSAAQIDAFRTLPHLKRTNRPIQPGNARPVGLVAGP